MNPPIPDPSTGPPPRNSWPPMPPRQFGPRPAALKTFIGISLIFWIAGWLIPTKTDSGMSPAIEGALAIFWMVILCLLWLGRNWARISVMVWCVVIFLAAFDINSNSDYYGTLEKIHLVFESAFSALWFWWLSSPKVVSFFKGVAE